MELDSFIAYLKRKTGYGNPAASNDQSAKNIKDSINQRIAKIVRGWLWDWAYKSISITLSSGTTDYTLDTDVASIIAIDAGNHNYLRNITLKEYLLYYRADSSEGETDTGDPGVYLYVGRDSSTGARIIRIDDIPSATSTLTGFAKKKITRFTDSDLGTAKSFLPFPEDGLDVLEEFVLSDIYSFQGKEAMILPQLAIAKESLKEWRGESQSEPASDVTTGLPAYYRNKKINRRKGYAV